MTGGNNSANTTTTKAPVPVDDAPLQQPSDAVPMESMAQSSASGDEPTMSGEAVKESAPAAAEPSAGPSTTPVDADQLQSDSNDIEISSAKANEEGAPVPPTKDRNRSDSVLAIGPAQDDVQAIATGQTDGGPVCNITLLLTSGSRHPYKIDARYLTRRNVTMPDETESGLPDPFSISVYTLKELILREWRSDWEAKPASPSSIRLIHFGKLLDDKEQLKSERTCRTS